jgi:hypothetical protein
VSEANLLLRSDSYAQIRLNGQDEFLKGGGAGGGRGVTTAVLDTNTGTRFTHLINFDTWADPATNFRLLMNFVNTLPMDAVISFVIGDEGGFTSLDKTMTANVYAFFEALGSTKVRKINYWGAWIFVTRKGSGALLERVNPWVAHDKTSGKVTAGINIPITPDIGAGKR